MVKTNKVKFYLEKRKDKETEKLITLNVPIQLFYSFNGQRLQYYTGYRIDEPLWDGAAMRINLEMIKDRKEKKEADKVNDELEKLEQKVKEIVNKADVNEEPVTLDLLRERLNGKDTGNQKTFGECWAEFITASEKTKTTGTIANLESCHSVLKKFAKTKHVRLEFDNINKKFYDRFLEYCFTDRKIMNASAGRLIKDLKAFLYWSTDEGYNKNMEFAKKNFKKLTEETEIVYLIWDELIQLYEHKFKKEEELYAQVRDLFCFPCFSGMRHSDVEALEKQNVREDSIIYRVEKTEEHNTIPLNPYSKAILKKYENLPGDKCFPQIPLQTINDTLKLMFAELEFNRKIQQTHFQGMKKIKTVLPLHEVITYHISKKTFMTNFLAKGGKLETAMAITGNTDYKTAKRYFKVVDSLKAGEMAMVFGAVSSKKKKTVRSK
ncbi:MAG: phage integrase SAM-like domain-containing protein [Bacteroidia bacterium]|nr:phage integrase SAM-like domain-containing protein [Bacteroidia bacterium]